MPHPLAAQIPHPSARYKDKIRLRTGRRGPQDDIWCAFFFLDGRWQRTKPVNLGTRDFHEAALVAIEKYTKASGGGIQAALTPRRPAGAPPAIAHRFDVYAERAAKKLDAEAVAADGEVVGKGHNFRQIAGRIRRDLVPKWGATDIRQLDEWKLTDWITDEYRVEDRAATVRAYGRQPRDATRQKVFKLPSITTLGNLDQALLYVWNEAAADKAVERRNRPMIDKSLGEEAEPRAFIDAPGVQAIARVMSDEWIATANGHGTHMKRMLRTYIAILACTGLRAGLEAERVRLCDVFFRQQQGKEVIFIRVMRRQAKHREPRSVIVYEGDPAFDIRRILTDHIEWRRSQGAGEEAPLFVAEDGGRPAFRQAWETALTQAKALTDPRSRERRVPYSLRHYFATERIEQGLSVPQIAEWLGTSSAMVERNYNQYLTERRAHLLNGHQARWLQQVRTLEDPDPDRWRTPEDDALDWATR